ncbi:hypothetical protein NDA16_001875 [Ustilago loliicola]|nr:hypothetical protein NDA16_001875 [Ustilago loliicola]
MQSLSRRLLSDTHVVQIYEWAERSPHAVLKCTCRQVRRIKTLPSFSRALGGQDLYLHHETPAVNAEVCGMVIGVTPKDDQVIYEVDDGTSVLRVIETRKSLRKAESRLLPAGASAAVACGIPECYIMPPQIKASASAQRFDSISSAPMLAPLSPRFEVADIVKCVGRIQIDRSGDRYLAAKLMAEHESVFPVKALNESYQSRSSQPNPRKLRTHDKIADHKLTESYFQLQLQQHISLRHHSEPFTLLDLSTDSNLGSLAGRLVRLRLQLRKGSRSVEESRRISSDKISKDTSEQHADKVKRLFECAIRKMMRDGFITLSESDQSGFSASATTGLSDHVESFHLVTPEYLLQPLRNLLGRNIKSTPLEAPACDIDDLTTRLRILDDRFRFVNRSLVQDSLDIYNARYAPIVID